MKIIKFFLILCLVSGLSIQAARSQAVVLKGETFYWGYYESLQSQVVMSPSGNILIKMLFQLDPLDSRIPARGSSELHLKVFFFFNGGYELEGEMTIHSDGKAVALFHLKD